MECQGSSFHREMVIMHLAGNGGRGCLYCPHCDTLADRLINCGRFEPTPECIGCSAVQRAMNDDVPVLTKDFNRKYAARKEKMRRLLVHWGALEKRVCRLERRWLQLRKQLRRDRKKQKEIEVWAAHAAWRVLRYQRCSLELVKRQE